MGGSSTVNVTSQRLNGLVVQSSSFGVRIPLVFGTTRISPNLIDYDDFTAIAHTTTESSGGKGGGGVTTRNTSYTYTVAAALGICSGPIAGIGQIWKDKAIYTADDLALSVYLGTGNQTPWPYMQTYHPEKALNYPFLCYAAGVIDLGDSANTPNLSFEVKGKNIFPTFQDANPNDILKTLLTDTTSGAGFPAEYLDDNDLYDDYCIANGLFISPGITSATQASEIINNVMQCSNSQPVNSQGVLYFVPYGIEPATGNGATYTPNLTPIYEIDDDDYIRVDGEDPVKLLRSDTVDRYNVQQVEFLNRADSYNADIATEPDQASIDEIGLRPASVVSLNYICDAVVAQKVAKHSLERGLYYPNQYQFKLPYYPFIALDPMDIVAMTEESMGMFNTLVRVINSDPDSMKEITFTVEEVGLVSSGDVVYNRQSADRGVLNFNADPGNVNNPVIFSPPTSLAGGLFVWIGASGGIDWGGCNVWVSEDGDTYKRVGQITNPSRQGVLTAALATSTDPDTTHTLAVNMEESRGQLFSGTLADADNFNTLCYVDGELVSYETATLTAANKYNLNYIRRGAYGTTISSHAIGASFMRVDTAALFSYPIREDMDGKTIYIKLTSFNLFNQSEQALEDVGPITYIVETDLIPGVETVQKTESILSSPGWTEFIFADGGFSDVPQLFYVVAQTYKTQPYYRNVTATTFEANIIDIDTGLAVAGNFVYVAQGQKI